MISSTAADTKDTIEALNNQQNVERCGRINSSGSGRSLLSMNLNFLGSEDIAIDGGLLSSGDNDSEEYRVRKLSRIYYYRILMMLSMMKNNQ